MIDWARVRELQQELGDEDFAEVVELFLDEIETYVMRLLHESPAGLEAALHFLNGCAVNIGFRALARRCCKGELDIREGRAAEVDIDDLLACYAETKRSFVAGLGRASHDRVQMQSIA